LGPVGCQQKKLSLSQDENARLQALIEQEEAGGEDGRAACSEEVEALRAQLERRRDQLRDVQAMLRSKGEEDRRAAQQARSKIRRLHACATALQVDTFPSSSSSLFLSSLELSDTKVYEP